MQKFFFLISFLVASWRSMMKIEGSRSASGSISQRHGSADPDSDPHQGGHGSATLLETGFSSRVYICTYTHDAYRLSSCLAGRRHASLLEAEIYNTGQTRPAHPRATKPVIENKHQLVPGPQIFSSWREMQDGGYIICLYLLGDWSSLMIPQKATLNSMGTLSWFASCWRLSPSFQFSLSAAALYRSTTLWFEEWCNKLLCTMRTPVAGVRVVNP